MPRPQVPDHDVAPARPGLDRRPDRPPRRLGRVRDPRDVLARAVRLVGEEAPARARRLLVRDGCLHVGPEPELGRAVGDREVAERDVGDEVVGAPGVVEGRVLVLGLAHARRVGQRCVGCEPVPDRFGAQVSWAMSVALVPGLAEHSCRFTLGTTYVLAICRRKELK